MGNMAVQGVLENSFSSAKHNLKRRHGRYYTRGNPFTLRAFTDWATDIGLEHRTILEPFAGANHIIRGLQEQGYGKNFTAFDINPATDDVQKRDTMLNFPTQYEVIVTNPPWLAKNSAKRRGITFPQIKFDDLYKQCLHLCLQNAPYVAALIPASFLQSQLWLERLHSFTLLHDRNMFCDTDNPVALALFMPPRTHKASPKIYFDDKLVGSLGELHEYIPKSTAKSQMRFNDPQGELGFIAFDNTRENSIRFCAGEDLRNYTIGHTTRMITRIRLNVERNIVDLIDILNQQIDEFRNNTCDVFLTPFKGLRQDGVYRRRMEYALARKFIECHA